MKANNGKGNVSQRDFWKTPDFVFNILDNQYSFSFDCCADVSNKKCVEFSDDFESIARTGGVAWMNPPFSKALDMFIHFFNIVDSGVAIYRCDNLETAIWQDLILKNSDWVFFFKGRIEYEGQQASGARFPSALIGVGLDRPVGLRGKVMS